MPIMNVAEEYPPGYIGDPYNGDDISKFFDLNWPDHAGILGQGYSAPGIGMFRGLGQACCDGSIPYSDGSCDDGSIPGTCSSPVTTPVVTGVDCTSFALTLAQAQACGISSPTGTTGDTAELACADSGGGWTGSSCVMPYTGGSVVAAGTPNQANYTAQQVAAITAAGGSAVSILRTAEGGPYTVAGTNLVYNPATGALTTAAAVNATAALTAGISSLTPYIPYIALAIGAIVLLPMLTGKK